MMKICISIDELAISSQLQVSQRYKFKLVGKTFSWFRCKRFQRALHLINVFVNYSQGSLWKVWTSWFSFQCRPLEWNRCLGWNSWTNKWLRPRRLWRNVGFHHTLDGSSQIDFFDGWPRGSGRNFRGGPAECARPLGWIWGGFSFVLQPFPFPSITPCSLEMNLNGKADI